MLTVGTTKVKFRNDENIANCYIYRNTQFDDVFMEISMLKNIMKVSFIRADLAKQLNLLQRRKLNKTYEEVVKQNSTRLSEKSVSKFLII